MFALLSTRQFHKLSFILLSWDMNSEGDHNALTKAVAWTQVYKLGFGS